MLRKIVQGLSLVGVVVGTGALGAGCLDRPVTAQAPTIKTNFTNVVSQSGIDKVDILFDIDNSASMGDKQNYLIAAIPQMIARLVTPRCIDSQGKPTSANADPKTGTCPSGSAPEFAAVHDMHIGVITSALGSRDGVTPINGTNGITYQYTCDPSATTVSANAGNKTISDFNDDKGHLINRTSYVPPATGTAAQAPGAPIAEAADNAGGSVPTPEGGFLYWYPTVTANVNPAVSPPASPIKTIGAAGTPDSLVGDFTEIVAGTGQSGCGIESQLESWYRFLIQPDPYLQIGWVDAKIGTYAEWQGVDTTIIQQRHDFLRPDSLVAVIVLTDENDSEIDVRADQATGWHFLSAGYQPQVGTSACLTNPDSAACKICDGTPATSGDKNCQTYGPKYTNANDWGLDLNLRHVHMRQKYGLSAGSVPQFPLTRYYYGLTAQTVPNRLGEYADDPPKDSYDGTPNCTNPLFASQLPTAADVPDATQVTPTEINTTLCKLPTGAVRTAQDVFFAHIGGVPHELLQNDAAACTAAGCIGAATDAASCATDCAQKDTLLTSDWIKILGNGTATANANPSTVGTVSYDYSGIDPHMLESQTPRNMDPTSLASGSIPAPDKGLSGPGFASSGADPVRPDPINGREFDTQTGVHSLNVDRQYACIFPLPLADQRDCATLKGDTAEGNSCDCVPGPASTKADSWASGGAAVATGNSPSQVPPLCSKAKTDGSSPSVVNDYTVQTHAKAYPTIRELTLADMMQDQGIVSSLCPIHTNDNAEGNDPLYGYRPAVNAIVNRLKSALGSQCVPKLVPDPMSNEVPCLVLVSFPTKLYPATTQCESIGNGLYTTPKTQVLQEFVQSQPSTGEAGAEGGIASELTCQLNQVAVPTGTTCVNGSMPGWCYVTGAGVSGSTCSQQISYSTPGLVPNGATISLQCISTNTANSGEAGAVATDAAHGG